MLWRRITRGSVRVTHSTPGYNLFRLYEAGFLQFNELIALLLNNNSTARKGDSTVECYSTLAKASSL